MIPIGIKLYRWLTDWQPTTDESGDMLNNSIVINKKKQHLYVYDGDGNVIFHSPVSTGKNRGQKQKEGDSRTPEGKFKVKYYTDRADKAIFNHNEFLGLDTGPWQGIGIHGDAGQPKLIGRPASHGCIRLPNDSVPVFMDKVGRSGAVGKTVYIK